MSSTTPEKKKKVVKIKKVVKKEKNVTSPAVKKINQNTHPNSNSSTKSAERTHRPSIEDAIARFSAQITEQTEMIEQLKLENQKLKNEVQALKTRPPETKVVYINSSKAAGGNGTADNGNGRERPMLRKQLSGPPQKGLPSMHRSDADSGVITNISQADAKNALSGLFGGAKQKPATNGGDAVITDISQNDAKNALSSLFGNKNPSQPSPAMNSNSNSNNLSIVTPSRLLKYAKLSKVMPSHVLENKMKMDGVTRMLIAQLTKQWLPATVPDGYKLVEKEVSLPPPIAHEFRNLIEKKHAGGGNDDDDDDEKYERLKALGLRPKKAIQPSRQMKRFHWKKIEPEHMPPTIWFKLDAGDPVPYNKTEFELKFSFKPPRTTDATKKKVVSKTDRSGQIYTFIDPKRSQNVQIALSKFKISHAELKAAVIAMNETVFNLDTLQQFSEIAPTEDEQRETELHANKDDVDPTTNFGRAEKFFYSFIDIVDLALRLKLWIFMMEFREVVSDKQAQIFQLDAACQKLTNCDGFEHILTMILAYGNHMNATSSTSGNAYGFEIDGLALLPGVKTMDGQMNMMMYLYKTLYEKFPDDLSVFDDLKQVKICSTFDTDMMDKTVVGMKEQFQQLQQTVAIFKDDYEDILDVDDQFVEYATKFVANNKGKLNKLVMLHQRIKNKCESLSVLYKWNLNENRVEGLFAVCAQFLSDLLKARDDLHKLELDRERRQKKKKKNMKRNSANTSHDKYVTQLLGKSTKVQQTRPQKHKRSIMDDVRARKRKNTIMLDKVGEKLRKALEEKSKLIETVNYKQKLPAQFQKNKVKRKISSIYGESVQKVKAVPKGRMRLPSIAAQLSAVSQNAETDSDEKEKEQESHLTPQKKTAAAKLRRAPVQKRKRTKGWFQKGKEPKPPPPRPMGMAYNSRGAYEQGYKSAHNRDRGISNHKSGAGGDGNSAARYRSDTPAHPTPLSALSDHDISVGQNRANQIHQQFATTHGGGPQYKRAQSMKVSSKKKSLLNRAAYSPPNSGIVRLDKLGLVNDDQSGTTSKKASDLNLPQSMLDGAGGDTQRVTILIESPAGSPKMGPKKPDEEFQFSEEHSWD